VVVTSVAGSTRMTLFKSTGASERVRQPWAQAGAMLA
jgi:hypothetical protein